mmetsp:Transcript_130895/g.418942  ORF Transcript_130895/g.418942 Transcript_130895/m.418942 type:complete len:146 (+) Transcript_130895:2551-2988(+)
MGRHERGGIADGIYGNAIANGSASASACVDCVSGRSSAGCVGSASGDISSEGPGQWTTQVDAEAPDTSSRNLSRCCGDRSQRRAVRRPKAGSACDSRTEQAYGSSTPWQSLWSIVIDVVFRNGHSSRESVMDVRCATEHLLTRLK